MSVKLKSIT